MTTAVSTQGRPPWVFRRFIKEKHFVRERYWHWFDASLAPSSSASSNTIIPDGVFWRKYLKLWALLASEHAGSVSLILLESAVELMDWRNSSPCLQTEDGQLLVSESTAIQEKNRLRNLVDTGKLSTFCDLAVREEECDEFDILDYVNMNLQGRCSCALVRASRMLAAANPNGTVYMVTDSCESTDREEQHVITSIDSLLDMFQRDELLSEQDLEVLRNTKQLCEEEYKRRNTLSVASSSANGTPFEYLNDEEVQQGLRDGSLARGRLDVTKENVREAFVNTSKGRFFVSQEDGHFNRAIHQDTVIVRPLPEQQWGRPVGRKRLVFHSDSEDADVSDKEGPTVPSAVVVAIPEPGRRIYVATLVDVPTTSDERAVIVIPMDMRIPRIRIQTKEWQKYKDQRLLVEIDHWDPKSNYPSGHCVEMLGRVGELETEIACLLLEHEIRFKPFSKMAVASLPPGGESWRVPLEEIESRRDLRKTHRIFSVDPSGCQDIDDTMHAKVLPNGDVEVGVHIADVTHFVPHGSALDLEAQARATTFYLVDRRFDMLPSLLSSNLCSLHGDMDRLAISVIWTMTPDLEEIKSTWFGKTIIHNCQAMTYEQAHNIVHNTPPDAPNQPWPPRLTAGYPVNPESIPALKQDLLLLTKLTRKLRKKREETGGAVDLSSGDLGNELKFKLDANGNPLSVAAKKELEIHHTIAELMILANQSVADKIYGAFPDSSLLRIHRSVEQERFENLEHALKAGGIAFDGTSNMALANSLKNAQQTGKGRSTVNALWQSLATRAMMEALYVSTGNLESGTGLSHYGLGIERYTHFTSPIRRYADVVVHKQLLAALERDSIKHSTGAPPGFSATRPVLESIPDSRAISILRGEGLEENKNASNKDIANDERLALATEDLVIADAVIEIADEEAQRGTFAPYSGTDVATICDNLNSQNRRAKLSSMQCQKLFLSLYFKNHVETTKAVVTDLRANGLLVFVPKYDMKSPIYLSDVHGDVQIDPSLVGLPTNSGHSPTLAFAAGMNHRCFPAGKVELRDGDGENSKAMLQVLVPGAPHKPVFRVLDVVTVQISCDLAGVKARVPPPRLHLVASSTAEEARQEVGQKVGTRKIRARNNMNETQPDTSMRPKTGLQRNSLYQVLTSIVITPQVPEANRRRGKPKPSTAVTSTISGRKCFSEFVNPDTRGAQQDAAVSAASEASALRRITHADDYDTSASFERAATARAQKLLAEKRNARRSKAK